MLDIRLLGQARVCADGVPIKFAKRGVTLGMLGYLVLHRDRAVSRDFLAFTLFPDLDEEAALRELRRYLYLAQKSLPADETPWIVADAESVSWNRNAAARIDVVEFERLAANPATLRDALALYEGELLPEVYEDWVLAERERLRALYLNGMSALVVQARSEREYGEAIAYAQRLLAHDPWREDVLRHLLAAHYELGDAAGALAEYDRFARRAREELRVEPMPETRALREAIAAGAALPSSLDRPRNDRHRVLGGLPFCGRGRDFERLRRAWAQAARGNGGIVAIEGEPGIGKSRLAAEFALAVESEGGRALAGTTSFPEAVPYQCVVDVMRAALPLVEALPQNALRTAILSQVLPELRAHAPDLREPPAVAPEREQARLFDAIGSTLIALARTRPLLIVLEDLHWAGRATLDLLRSLARRTSRGTLLIVVTLRDEEVPPEHPLRALQRELAGERLALRVPLARLTREDVADILERLSDRPLDADRLFTYSEGNPLFLNEAIHESLERGQTDIGAGGIGEIIERRLARLSANAKRVAFTAAVCGNAFDADVVCDASGASGAESLAAIGELLDRHVVREAGTAGGFEYAFTHHLIAATLYELVAPADRRQRHARVARALERVHHATLDRVASEIGRHYGAAGENAAAAGWYARAARSANAMFAHDDASRYATQALELGGLGADTAAMLLVREEANSRLGRRADQIADLDRLDALALDDTTRCEVLHRRIEVLHALEDREAERRAIGELRAHAERANDRKWQSIADCAEAWLDISIGRYTDAKPLAMAALDRLESAGSAAERTRALWALAEIEVSLGERAVAEGHLNRAQRIAREADDGRAQVDALMQTVAVAMSQQEFDRVADFGTQAVALYRLLGDRIGEARALVNVAAASLRLSRWEAARNANLSAAATFELVGDRRGLSRVLMNLGMLHARCGDFAEGRRLFERAREHQTLLGDERACTASLLNESFLALWQGRAKEAKALAKRALALAGRMQHAGYRAQALANLGAAERDLGELDRAVAHMDEGLAIALELGRLPNAVSDLADAALARMMRGEREAALQLVERILAIDRAWADATIFPPYPPWVAAQILHAYGDHRGRDVLRLSASLARSLADSIDVPQLRERFEALPFVAEIAAAVERDAWPSVR